MASYRTQPIIPAIVSPEPIAGTARTFVPGEYGGTGIAARLGNSTNSLADLTRDKDDQDLNLRMIGSAYVDVKLLKGLNFRCTVGGTYATMLSV